MTALTRFTAPTRRGVLAFAGAAAASALAPPFAWAMGRTGLHGLSIFGDLAYPADFPHFKYVDPDAPKGGRMNFSPPYWVLNQSTQTFNTLNSFVLKGDAPPRMEITFDSLMVRAEDEPDAVYGLVAGTVDVNDDASVYTFHLRPEARFRDGSPLTAADVAFSLTLLKKEGHPSLSQTLTAMASAEAVDDATVVVTLSDDRTRETILAVVDVPILSQAYYADRTFDASTMEAPLGSGPYRVDGVNAGRYIEYRRDPSYWAADLPVMRGHNNFDVIRIDFYVEREAGFESFKKGETTYREEFSSLSWATAYEFPAIEDGRVKRNTAFASEARPDAQGWFFNARRAKFADPRTRHGIALAFDYEWTNRNLFFDSYTRQASYFEKSDLAASGLPSAAELELLEPFRDTLPPEVFEEAYVPPVTDGSGRDRTLLRQAQNLLIEAGWRKLGNSLVNDDGEPLTVEFMTRAAVFERILGPYVENLRLIGVDASIRQVDPTQFTARMDSYDFDIVGYRSSPGATPFESLRLSFNSELGKQPGGQNLSGVDEPAIDAILRKLTDVGSRDDLIAIARSIDRIFRARHYWNPNWYLAEHRVAHWDIFGWPATKPDFAFKPELWWWFDTARAGAIGYKG